MDRVLIAAGVLALVAVALLLLRARRDRRVPERVEPEELDLPGAGVGVVLFSGPYCLSCQRWEEALTGAAVRFRKVDVSERPDLARRYRVSRTPLLLAVRLPEGDVVASFRDEPAPGDVGRVRELTLSTSSDPV